MSKRKYLDTEKFQILLKDFLSIPTYTKDKTEKKKLFFDFLDEHKLATIISVKPNSIYNHCSKTHSFTIFQVPDDQKGKLFKYREKWVLILCCSHGGWGWGEYWNQVYQLNRPFTQNELKIIKSKFNDYFVLK